MIACENIGAVGTVRMFSASCTAGVGSMESVSEMVAATLKGFEVEGSAGEGQGRIVVAVVVLIALSCFQGDAGEPQRTFRKGPASSLNHKTEA